MLTMGGNSSPLAALATKASLLAEQLGTGLYTGSEEGEIFPSMAETIRLKHAYWSAELKKYGSSGENLVGPIVQTATKKLREEEARLRKLHSSCYMQCFVASTFMFPKDLTASLKGVIDVLENLPLLLEDSFEGDFEDSGMFTTLSLRRDLEGYSKLINEPDFEKLNEELYLEEEPNCRSKLRTHSHLPFKPDKRFEIMQSYMAEIKQSLERADGAHVVVMHGCPGTGRSSLAKHLAFHYNENGNSRSHFGDGIVYLSCSGAVDIKAKQLELLCVLNYPLHLLLTSGDSQHLSGAEIHNKLVEHMSDRNALIVLDNVEDSDILQHVLVPSPKVKYLVTSELKLLWADTLNLRVPPLQMDEARRFFIHQLNLDRPLGGADFARIPRHIQDVADKLIMLTGFNPLALASLALAISSRTATSCTRSGDEWREVESKFRSFMQMEDEGVTSLGTQYPRRVAVSIALAVDHLHPEAKSILFAVAAFDDLAIPELVVRLLLRCTGNGRSNFAMWKEYLADRGLIQEQREAVPWSSNLQTTLSIHGIRKHCVTITRKKDLGRMIESLLNQLQFRGDWRDESYNTEATLMAALFVVYGEGEVAARAAAALGVCDFSHMGCLILTWLAPLVSLLHVPEDEEEWQQQFHMTHILARQVIVEFVYHGNPESGIIGLLALPEAARTMCWALAVHALDKPLIMASNAIIQSLLALLGKHMDPATQKDAAWALSNIAVSDEFKQYNLARFPGFLGGFVRLMGYSKDYDDEVQCIAAWTAMVLGEADENRLALATFPGALQNLVCLLGKGGGRSLSGAFALNSDTASNAAGALANITASRENKVTVANLPGALQSLVRLLKKDISPSTQGKAAWALANMAEAEENKVRIADFPGALEGLVRLLSVEEYHSHSMPAGYHHHYHERLISAKALGNLNAAWALASLADAREIKIKIAEYPGALKGLVRLLSKDVNSQTRCSAAWAIVHLAEAVENKKFIVSVPGAVEGLVSLLDPNETLHLHRDTQQHATWTWRNLSAAWALGSLAEAEENKSVVASCPGALRGLVLLLNRKRNSNLQIQSRAAWALANIAAASSHQESLAAFPGALEGLVGLLDKDLNQHTQSNAARALAHLVEARKNRVLVANFPGALEGLVWLLERNVSSYHTQNNAARALATLATAEENQVLIANCSGVLDRLVRLLDNSTKPAVQINAAWTLCNLAEASTNKIKISSYPGVVEKLLRLLQDDVEPGVQAVAARTLTQIAAQTSNRLILSSGEAYRSRAVINIEMENYQQALSDLDEANNLQPENPYTFRWLRLTPPHASASFVTNPLNYQKFEAMWLSHMFSTSEDASSVPES